MHYKKIEKKIGKDIHEFTVEGSNLFELIQEQQKYSFGDVEKCGLCASENLILNSRLAQKKFKYVEIKCLNCKGSLVFGNTIDDPNTYYLRRDKQTKKYDWKEYKPEETEVK